MIVFRIDLPTPFEIHVALSSGMFGAMHNLTTSSRATAAKEFKPEEIVLQTGSWMYITVKYLIQDAPNPQN